MGQMMNNIIPFERSFWVVPGKLLAGHLPARKDNDIMRSNILNLLNVGVRVFINLMESTEKDLDGSDLPAYEKTLQELSRAENLITRYYNLPITDLGVPSVSKMTEILDTLDDSINSALPVYIHCWGGKGRTGTVIGCYLIRHGMATTQNVIDMIKYLRRTDPKSDFSSPETEEQVMFVKNWKQNQ